MSRVHMGTLPAACMQVHVALEIPQTVRDALLAACMQVHVPITLYRHVALPQGAIAASNMHIAVIARVSDMSLFDAAPLTEVQHGQKDLQVPAGTAASPFKRWVLGKLT